MRLKNRCIGVYTCASNRVYEVFEQSKVVSAGKAKLHYLRYFILDDGLDLKVTPADHGVKDGIPTVFYLYDQKLTLQESHA